MITNLHWIDEFIKREKNFYGKTTSFPKEFHPLQHAFFSKIQQLEETAENLFDLLHDSDEKDIAKVKSVSKLNKEGLLIVIIKDIYEIVIASNDEYKFFDKDSFLKLCPNFKNVEDGRKIISGQYTNSYLDSIFYQHMLEACLFTTLCSFINSSKRKAGLSIQKTLEEYYQPKRDTGVKFKPVIEECEKENIRKMKQRLFSKRGSYNKRSEWSAIPLDSANELASTYELRFYDFLKKEFDNRELPDKKLANVFKRIGNLNNEIEKVLTQPYEDYSHEALSEALKKFLSKIKKISYADYLALNKYILSKICENRENYGINLYRFEKSLKFYAMINDVNLLLNCSDKEKEDIIFQNIFHLRDIPFPKLYQCFCYIESPANFIKCLKAFYSIRDNVVWTSRLVLDKLVENGHFGDGDKWYYFFLEMINNMAEQILYDPAKIDYSIEPGSQTKFEQVLSAPLRYFEEYAK
ncbi:hypothetical protein [Anaerosinus gibii]|uniref:Uncharacterized protein n=1 Tax=Selenobaculum gibii TaxID=3054208 RepID=A0A9Y2AKJ6_9FIRM|nr:hypothetical protein [Selenobaculum gbiensis]WIW71458.1 hypothetical protein P3F81_03900 [Selenobaculum gbiensis]